MTVPGNALLLVGSPRTNSTSEILGAFLIDQTPRKGTRNRESPHLSVNENGQGI